MKKKRTKLWSILLIMAITACSLTGCSGCGKRQTDAGSDSLVAMNESESMDIMEEFAEESTEESAEESMEVSTEVSGEESEEETLADSAEVEEIKVVESATTEAVAEETETLESTEGVVPEDTKEAEDEKAPAQTPKEEQKETSASTTTKNETSKTPEPSKEPETQPSKEPKPEPAPQPTPTPAPAPQPTPEESKPAEHVHTLVEEVAEATCETAKTITTKCSNCGHVEGTRIEGNALGHDYRESVWSEPTCYSQGYHNYICNRCDFCGPESGPMAMLPHTYETKIFNEGDCKSPQTKKDICTVCGYETSFVYDYEIHANDHEWETGTVKVWSDEVWGEVEVERTRCKICNRDKPE